MFLQCMVGINDVVFGIFDIDRCWAKLVSPVVSDATADVDSSCSIRES